MSQVLIDKIRKAREQTIEADGFSFTIRRPTDLQIRELRGNKIAQADILCGYVVGWDGVKERDLIPGGTPEPVTFDRELFIEWVADKPAIMDALIPAVVDAYRQHEAELEDTLKKPATG